MQCRWGSHGDYAIIALCPNSPQECFDLTITAFNLSEQYRVPVLVMMDECVGHMTEKVVIPSPDKIEITPRRYTTLPPDQFKPYAPAADLVPDMPPISQGYAFHVTGLTHDERGYPNMTPDVQDRMIRRLVNKIENAVEKITITDEENLDDADVVVVSYGITSRVAQRAIDMARAKGLKVGKLRLITAWPFPDFKIEALATRVKAFVVPEINLGQMSREVQRAANGKCKTVAIPHAGGSVHRPQQILQAIEEALR
jgi:2-oxoglutarate ferredoxin oxidoreductase subunit alpha